MAGRFKAVASVAGIVEFNTTPIDSFKTCSHYFK
jgi:hypothetical protein